MKSTPSHILQKVVTHFGYYFLFLVLSVFFVRCAPTNLSVKQLIVYDSLSFDIPISLYSDDLGSPDFKIDFVKKSAYFFSQDDKSLIVYDINKHSYCTFNSTILMGRQHLFNFSAINNRSFTLYANPTYNGGYHDKTVFSITDLGIHPIKLNFDKTNIRTSSNYESVEYASSTFLTPIRMEPIWLKDSSVIIACTYAKVPGTIEHALLNKGQFIKLHKDKTGEYLPIRFPDLIPKGSYYAKSLAEPFGFQSGDSMIFTFGISNDIYFYSISKNKLSAINRKKPLVAKLQSSDTTFSRAEDYSQNEFLYLIHNPILNENYRIVKLTQGKGYLLILMDEKFKEIGLYQIPLNLCWPFHYSPNGLYAYRKNSYDQKKKYTFVELTTQR